jgi:prepilin-type N-terminal cleavage/methylation domain-containing protein
MGSNRKARLPQAQVLRKGLSLIEVLITLAVISILAGILIPQLQADIPDRLIAVGQIVASDLEYARSLAVANNSKYIYEFNVDENRYHLEHSGTSLVLEALPPNPFRPSDDEIDEQTTDLQHLPIGSPTVELIGVLRMAGSGVEVASIEYGPNGGTTRSEPTVIWLGCGYGDGRRFLSLTVNPTTGLAEVGEVTVRLPTGLSDRSSWISHPRPARRANPAEPVNQLWKGAAV